MEHVEDFIIEWGTLKKYRGNNRCLILPNGITGIEENAFSGCARLEEIFIPKSVTTIGKNAFKGCYSLKILAETDFQPSGWCQRKLFFGLGTECWNPENRPIAWGQTIEEPKPESQEETKITMPIFVKEEITEEELEHLRQIRELKKEIERLQAENETLEVALDFLSKQLEEARSRPLPPAPPKPQVKESKATKINTERFTIENGTLVRYYGYEKTVIVPKEVVRIGERAFADQKDMKTVVLPKSVKIIGKKAFYECKSLTSIRAEGVTLVGEHAFTRCKKLTTVELGCSVKEIGLGAFYGCFSLKEIKALGVETVRDYAFFDCNKLTTVEFGGYPKKIGEKVFENNSGEKKELVGTTLEKVKPVVSPPVEDLFLEELKKLIKPKTTKKKTTATVETKIPRSTPFPMVKAEGQFQDFIIENGKLRLYKGFEEKVIVPDDVLEIGDEAFKGQKDIKTITLPKSVKIIGKKAFFDCVRMTSIIAEGVTVVDDHAFANCKKLTTVKLGDNVKRIGLGAFHSCSSLKEIRAWGVKILDEYAFWGCSKLELAEFGNEIAEISKYTFCDCRSLKELPTVKGTPPTNSGAKKKRLLY